MDLCCLIDSDERTTASNLVTLLGDLLERGKPPTRKSTLLRAHLITLRNQVSRQTAASCSDTHRQADPRPFSGTTVRYRLRYRLRKQTRAGEHTPTHVLRYDRPCQSPNHGALPYVRTLPSLSPEIAEYVPCTVKVWSKRRCVISNPSPLDLTRPLQEDQFPLSRNLIVIRLRSASFIFPHPCQEPSCTTKSAADVAHPAGLEGISKVF